MRSFALLLEKIIAVGPKEFFNANFAKKTDFTKNI